MSIIQPPGPARKSITPIPTSYRGYRFRSRLEARWAVVFDHLGLSWEYEAQGYIIDGRPYLPDFRIVPSHCEYHRAGECTCQFRATWVEVKGAEDQLDKPFLLRAATQLDGLLILGPIPDPPGRWAGTQGDWYWPYLHGQDIDSVSLGRVHDKGRLWWIFAEEPHTTESAWLQPILCNDGSKVSVDAYRAGRSARFEHGESGTSQ